MTTHSAPDPFWRRALAFLGRLAEVVYVVAMAASHMIGDYLEWTAHDVAAWWKSRRRRRVISVTRRKV